VGFAAIESLRQHKPFLTSKVTEFVLDDYIRRGELREDAPREHHAEAAAAIGDGSRGLRDPQQIVQS
jgi:hypothetical protein